VPDDRTLVIERCRDELGDWRLCLLSPFGGRVLAPWAMASVARIRDLTGLDVETMWTDEGFVVRFPEIDAPPDPMLLVPPAEDVEALVMRQLGSTALFAGKFREVAARALLLPRRRPGGRAPLWQQRKRAADLLAVAARFGSFPALLETYRECLRDVFDMPALVETLKAVQRRTIRVAAVDSGSPSPFAATLLFGYVANYIYDGDAPLAERRAQALSVDQAQLRELLGDAELRELLDADAIADVERELQALDDRRRARSADSLHDLLLRIGDLSAEEIRARTVDQTTAAAIRALVAARRALEVQVGGDLRYVAVEDAARYRDALGVPLPPGIPESLLTPVRDALGDLALRYARTHGPFTVEEFAARFTLSGRAAADALRRVAAGGRLMLGEFRPHGTTREWCEADVLRSIRRRSLARLRHEVEPVDPAVLGRFVTTWQGLTRPRRGADALLDAIEQLQGAALAASILETEILPARIAEYRPADLDLLVSAGEVAWVGVEPLGLRDGRVALYLADHLPLLAAPGAVDGLSDRAIAVLDVLRRGGAAFFGTIHDAAGGGYPGETVDALWTLVWRGLLTNDTLQPLRAFVTPPDTRKRKARGVAQPFRSRRTAPPTAEGRWSLVASRGARDRSQTEWSAALARQLLTRHGLVTREAAATENLPGGFSAVYPVFKAMEESGRIRRGYFVAGLGATQFAMPAAVDLLRSFRDQPERPDVVTMSATDPANPYGSVLPWPRVAPPVEDARGPTRMVGSTVILVDGALAAYLGRSDRQLLVYVPDEEPARSRVGDALAAALHRLALGGFEGRRTLFISDINGARAADHPAAPFLARNGFVLTAMGFQARRPAEGPLQPAASTATRQ
jgi:ATP-dependent helicase Lhr and Lhr-like helicase